MNPKILYITGASLFLTIIIGVIFVIHRTPTITGGGQKCPDDFADDDAGSAEYLAAINQWTNDFYDTHPGATLSEWSRARYQFWVDNDCVEALRGYREVKEGSADPATIERVRKGIQEALDSYAQ